MTIHLVVLNYNGRALLAECLPSVLRAAGQSRHACDVLVVDNDSTDDSVSLVSARFPQVRIVRRANRGLCSYNDVLSQLAGPVAVLLNNDIKLSADCLDPLVEPLLRPERTGTAALGGACFMTTPLCWLFDGETYEGLQTELRWRWGLVQALSDYPGYQRSMFVPRATASAGAVMAVDRRIFLELGGFDSLYLPGRIEDLDFAFRAYQAGYHARYVPSAVVYHKGQASYRAAFGLVRSDALALRNTLLFQWKNLRHPLHVARHLASLPVRLVFDWLRAPWAPGGSRLTFTKALAAALVRWRSCFASRHPPRRSLRREREFFRRFDARAYAADAAGGG